MFCSRGLGLLNRKIMFIAVPLIMQEKGLTRKCYTFGFIESRDKDYLR